MPQERSGIITFKGGPLTLIGPELRVGDKAPDFTVLATDLTPLTLRQTSGRPRLIASVPSLDTGVCDAEARRFNEEAAKLPGVSVMVISMDLPFAQARWCGNAGIERVKTYSDHRDASFGTAFGVLIKELRLLARAVFVLDANDSIRYVQIVPEVTDHPDYDRALAAARQLA
ncbi:MAG TPA: thiol peroxidase [Limnochordia bacterium]